MSEYQYYEFLAIGSSRRGNQSSAGPPDSRGVRPPSTGTRSGCSMKNVVIAEVKWGASRLPAAGRRRDEAMQHPTIRPPPVGEPVAMSTLRVAGFGQFRAVEVAAQLQHLSSVPT